MWRKTQVIGITALVWLIALFVGLDVPAQTSGTLDSGQQFDVSQAFGPGDVKEGYESVDYETQSRSLLSRRGIKQDLIKIVENPPLGLPPVEFPADNPITRAKIDLGRLLFFDRRLSINNTVSCANCHIAEQGFTNNEISTAVGVEGRIVIRNAPTLYNVAYLQHIFLDGREISLENQVWQPITARNEMAAPSIGYVINKIKRISDYDGLFEAAFEGRSADIATIGYALASYQRTLLSADSPFDRWYFGGNEDAVNESVKRGFAVFAGKGQCSVCHQINNDHALFIDHQFHNTGLGYAVSTGKTPTQIKKKTRVQLAPGVFVDMPNETIQSVSRVESFNDLGLYRVTENPADRWKFRTQTLRNVALTAPYMHNGQFATLREVIDFYDQGGIPNELLSPFIRPLGLTESEKIDLEAFLESLTGQNVPQIVADAFAAQIGELSKDDPNWAHQNTLGF
ncbi:MAG: methylamine utilization protein MauG [Gammaproteobacteria bacterium]|nr:methylamine utilization protein MauG [Gammaproteobacteria bacterium]